MINRKYLLFALFGLALWIIVSLFWFLIIPKNKTTSPIPIPSFTGAAEEKLPADVEQDIKLFARLRDLTPITKNEFELSFDYKKNVFIVTLAPPYENNKKKFLQWIQDNGYQSLPKDEFVFYVK